MSGAVTTEKIWRLNLWVILVGACAPLVACALGVGDSAARITGVIVDETQGAYHDCRIDLFHVSKDAVLDSRRIDSHFLITFVLPERPASYKLRVSCSESGEAFESKPVLLGDLRKTYASPLDLGTVVLRRRVDGT